MLERNQYPPRSWRSMGSLILVGVIIAVASVPDTGFVAGAPGAVLHLAGDAHVNGELLPSENAGQLRWAAPAFVKPFDFAIEAVKRVDFSASAGVLKPQGEYCFELIGEDVLFGSVVRWTEAEILLEIPRLGRLLVQRDHIQSLHRWNVAELVHVGPSGTAGWKELDGTGQWSEEAGQPLTDRPGAALFGDFGIPPQAIIEFELAWNVSPDFVLALGVADDPRSLQQAFRIEVWPRSLTTAMLANDARQGEPVEWDYTEKDPGENWFEPGFQGGRWRQGPAGFGTPGTPGAIVRTEWSTPAIWLRRRFQVTGPARNIALSLHHDEDAEVWINGKLVLQRQGHIADYITVALEQAHSLLQQGENTIAVHCRQTGGGQYIDVGIIDQGSASIGDLVAVRKTSRGADVAALGQVDFGAGGLHLVAHLDQEAGRMLFFSPDGTQVADLGVAGEAGAPAQTGLLLKNLRGDVRLKRLRISRWNGASPPEVIAGRPRLQRRDGSIVYGQLVAVDANSQQLVLRDGETELRVPAQELSSVVLTPPAEVRSRSLRVIYEDGTQLSGELLGVNEQQLQLSIPSIAEPLWLPRAGLRSLVGLKEVRDVSSPPGGARAGILQVEGLQLPGRLRDGLETAAASALVWQPDHSSTASPLRPGASGRITYREPPLRATLPATAPEKGGWRQLLAAFSLQPRANQESGRSSLHLRAGDTIPCMVSRIDERGVSLKSPVVNATFVAHDKVKALELGPVDGPPRLSKGKRERLLMLPRQQTPSPPTHLIRSKNGDFLRGDLISMDEKNLQVEVRAEAKKLPRDLISHILWLHADELTPAAPETRAEPVPAASATRVQALHSDGNRLTFQPGAVAGNVLSGASDVLGACQVDLAQVDQLLLGEALKQASLNLPYLGWKLHRAIDPIYIQVLEEPRPQAPMPGVDSELVGKPAPDFELELLDGKKFRLSSSRGQVIVLEFWASWCGPCLQYLPQLERALRDINDDRVELIAVNLEEQANQIISTLQRHRLQLTVALDRDGVVAGKYAALAIPQTVVIDPTGKVARLFVGGGPQVAEHARNAVRDLLPAREE